jgi:hypothetical protein
LGWIWGVLAAIFLSTSAFALSDNPAFQASWRNIPLHTALGNTSKGTIDRTETLGPLSARLEGQSITYDIPSLELVGNKVKLRPTFRLTYRQIHATVNVPASVTMKRERRGPFVIDVPVKVESRTDPLPGSPFADAAVLLSIKSDKPDLEADLPTQIDFTVKDRVTITNAKALLDGFDNAIKESLSDASLNDILDIKFENVPDGVKGILEIAIKNTRPQINQIIRDELHKEFAKNLVSDIESAAGDLLPPLKLKTEVVGHLSLAKGPGKFSTLALGELENLVVNDPKVTLQTMGNEAAFNSALAAYFKNSPPERGDLLKMTDNSPENLGEWPAIVSALSGKTIEAKEIAGVRLVLAGEKMPVAQLSGKELTLLVHIEVVSSLSKDSSVLIPLKLKFGSDANFQLVLNAVEIQRGTAQPVKSGAFAIFQSGGTNMVLRLFLNKKMNDLKQSEAAKNHEFRLKFIEGPETQMSVSFATLDKEPK